MHVHDHTKSFQFIFAVCILLGTHLPDYAYSNTDIPPFAIDDAEVTTGCPVPDLRFVRAKKVSSTTEQPYLTFETTQIYLPDDFSTTDVEYGEHVDEVASVETEDDNADRKTRYTDYNPYAYSNGDGSEIASPGSETIHTDSHQSQRRNKFRTSKPKSAKHRPSSIRRRPHNQQKREVGNKFDNIVYVQSADIISQLHTNINSIVYNRTATAANNEENSFMNGDIYDSERLQQRKQQQWNESADGNSNANRAENRTMTIVVAEGKGNKIKKKIALQRAQDTDNGNGHGDNSGNGYGMRVADGKIVVVSHSAADDVFISDDTGDAVQVVLVRPAKSGTGVVHRTSTFNGSANVLRRVKRKSGKAAGALSRPKGGGDTGVKSTSRKKEGLGYEDENNAANIPIPVFTDEHEHESEEEEEIDEDEEVHFDEVTEVRFPGEVGPLGDRRLCKIRCVKGKWVGPLCATNEEDMDEHGLPKFVPLYKSCTIDRIPPHLLLSYRNISVSANWDVPHGHSLQARCKDLGLYKLLGETRVLCSNGLWAPRMPSCVPTTLLTNFSDDSPPSIRIKVSIGSGTFEPSGVLAVLPSSTVFLDCMYLRRRGNPEWTWTGWRRAYKSDWTNGNGAEEKATKYRLTIKDIQPQESGTYTCTSPRGLTNSIVIIVTMSSCPQPVEPFAPLILRLEGVKLGQRAVYSCPIGYTVEGVPNATCLASGNWSSPPPICNPVQCPSLFLEDPHLSLSELNTSAWGKATFKCSWGYRLNGPAELDCLANGAWSGAVPRCRSIQCTQPQAPINGRIDGASATVSHRKYAVGSLVTFSCNEGHLLVGEASIVCTETGSWSHTAPFCKSQCPYPGDPPNGLIAPLKFYYDPGDFLTVQCRPGFVEYGANGPPERPRCLPDGNWSEPVPQCRNYEEV